MLTLNESIFLVHKADIPISRDAFRRLADKNLIPCTKTERGLRLFKREDVAKFIEEYKSKTNATPKVAFAA